MANIVDTKKGETATSGNVRIEAGFLAFSRRALHLRGTPQLNAALRRHVRGDWGTIADWVKRRNEEAVDKRDGVISEYGTEGRTPFMIVTQPHWGFTFIMLRDELRLHE